MAKSQHPPTPCTRVPAVCDEPLLRARRRYADKYEHLDAAGALERGLAAHARYVAALRGLPAPALGSHRQKLLRLRRRDAHLLEALQDLFLRDVCAVAVSYTHLTLPTKA